MKTSHFEGRVALSAEVKQAALAPAWLQELGNFRRQIKFSGSLKMFVAEAQRSHIRLALVTELPFCQT